MAAFGKEIGQEVDKKKARNLASETVSEAFILVNHSGEMSEKIV